MGNDWLTASMCAAGEAPKRPQRYIKSETRLKYA